MVVYLADVDDWAKFNSVYKEVMPAPYPTRTAVGANLRGITIEISAVAYVGKGS
jgi:2-iminobutanoate/2-iminopropanoate deaminase